MNGLDKDDAEFLDGLFAETDPRLTLSERRDAVLCQMKSLDRTNHADRSRVGRVLWWALAHALQGRFYKIEHGPRIAYVTPERQGTMPKRYAHAVVDPKTGRFNGYMQAVMVDMAWSQFRIDLRRVKEKWTALGRNIEIWDRVALLEEKYPNTKGPREACELEGIDPDVLLDFAA
jgi:hypothetical protein